MKKNFKKVNAGIIVIGNEILSGRTQDLNVSFIAKWLNEKNGITVHEVRVIPDVEKIIIKTTSELWKFPMVLNPYLSVLKKWLLLPSQKGQFASI